MRRRRHSLGQRGSRYSYTSEAAARDLFTRAVLASPTIRNLLREIEDRREFHPAGDYRRARGLSRIDQSDLVLKRSPGIAGAYFRMPRDSLRFAVPSHVVKCIRRKERREVIFAMGGRGKGAKSPRRRDEYSDIHCK